MTEYKSTKSKKFEVIFLLLARLNSHTLALVGEGDARMGCGGRVRMRGGEVTKCGQSGDKRMME